MKTPALALAVFLAAATAGCEPAIQVPPGAIAFKCKTSTAPCLQGARSACPQGFRVVAQGQHAGGELADILPGPVTWFDVAVRCDANAPKGHEVAVDCGQVMPLTGNQYSDPMARIHNQRVESCRWNQQIELQQRATRAVEGAAARAVAAPDEPRPKTCAERAKARLAECAEDPDCDADSRERIVKKLRACNEADAAVRAPSVVDPFPP